MLFFVLSSKLVLPSKWSFKKSLYLLLSKLLSDLSVIDLTIFCSLKPSIVTDDGLNLLLVELVGVFLSMCPVLIIS